MVSSLIKNVLGKIRRVQSSKVEYMHEDYNSLKSRPFSIHLNLFNASFRDCMRLTLITVQLMGLLPVYATRNGGWQFRVLSVKCVYSILIGLSILGISGLSLLKSLRDDLEFDKIVTFIYYFIDFVVVVQFLVLAWQWDNIMTAWAEFEKTLDQNEQLLGRRISLKVTFDVIIISVTLMTLVVEILAVIAGIEKGAECTGVQGDMKRYFRQQFPQLFTITEYVLWKGIIVQCIQFICTFIRMFLDVFLILVSIGMCRLIERLNLQHHIPRNERVMTESFWVRYKEHYLKFMQFVAYVDKRIGHLIILCFLSDLYLICVRILNSLKSLDTFRHALYFWYALIFLILRLIFVCYFAANLHKEAKRPLNLLCNVPASRWCVEAQRFQDLVTQNDVCLTGMGYFKLRRSLLLSVRIILETCCRC